MNVKLLKLKGVCWTQVLSTVLIRTQRLSVRMRVYIYMYMNR